MNQETSRYFVFSTDSVLKDDRVAVFRECICRSIVQVGLVVQGVSPFRGQVRIRNVGSVGIAEITSTAADYLRDAGFADDGNDDLLVVLWRVGCASANQYNTEIHLEPGDGVVLDNSREWQLHMIEAGNYWALQIPKYRIRRLFPGVDDAAGTKLHGGGAALRFLQGYLESTRADDFDDERAATLFGDHLVDLVALALDAKGEPRKAVEQGGARALHLEKVLREIEKRSAEPGLNAAAIAKQLEVTPRYVHRLLEHTGQSFSQHVMEKRLDRAATLLRDIRWRTRKIGEIAGEVGFVDFSHFNRAFRRRFGGTPSSFRAGAIRKLNRE